MTDSVSVSGDSTLLANNFGFFVIEKELGLDVSGILGFSPITKKTGLSATGPSYV